MDTKKQQKNPEQARREENTQQLTELKYLKTQLAAKDAKIKELEAKVSELKVQVVDLVAEKAGVDLVQSA